MDTSRITHLFLQHLPEFFRKSKNNQIKKILFLIISFLIELSHKENDLFASMTNIHHNNEENYIYDTDGYLLFMQTTQSNLSLFNISCDSLISNENEHFYFQSRQTLNRRIKHYNSSIDIHLDIKKSNYYSTIIFSEEIFSSKTNTLQRWRGLELLNTYA